MGTPTRIGLIGTGGFAAYHLAVIDKLQNEGLVKLVAVADPGDPRGVRCRLEAQGVTWYDDYTDMLAREHGLESVSIVAPIASHDEMTRACLERDLFVYLEKPPVPLIQQLEELIELDRRKRVCVGFQMVASRGIQRMKKALIGRELGEIQSIRARACWPRQNTYYSRARWAGKMSLCGKPVFDGPATNGLAHLIHNIMFLASPHPDEFAIPQQVEGELFRARSIESYDVACLRGEFPSGIRFSTALTHATENYVPFSLKVSGSEGWMSVSEDGDGSNFDSSFGEKYESTGSLKELLEMSYLSMLSYISGTRPRALTHLSDTRGYVMATNAMLVSSGGIREIDDCWVRRFPVGENEGIDVAGLEDAVLESGDTGKLFSEMHLPWAAEPPKIIPLDSALAALACEKFGAENLPSAPGK